MKDEEQLIFHLHDDPLADAVQIRHATAFDGLKWRVNRAQQKRRDQPNARDALAHDSWPQRMEVQEDVGEFWHALISV
jgi:hypothetical protein